jgi:tRNA-specific 2-thiouridylase
MKVIVAMSGGVDSSVAAYLLKKQGHEVAGLSLELWDKRDLKDSGTCCSVETIQLAKSVADSLGIDHFTADVRDIFYNRVIESFCESYLKGMTPNPCILCNQYIKFDFLLQKAAQLGADMVATGHYARIKRRTVRDARRATHDEQQMTKDELRITNYELPAADDERTTFDDTRHLLLKGVDPKKDQSYVLYVMKQEELGKTLFPLGEMKKSDTRSIAEDLGLVTALRPESQEICFVGNNKYADFMKGFSPESLQPGAIVDMNGAVLGQHDGIAFYTIGQRRGLGIQSLSPHYVVKIDHTRNTVMVGSRDDVMEKTIIIKELNWISMGAPDRAFTAGVKIRSTMKEVPATISPVDQSRVRVEFDSPQWAPAPGQSAVFYHDDVVAGGGIIEKK